MADGPALYPRLSPSPSDTLASWHEAARKRRIMAPVPGIPPNQEHVLIGLPPEYLNLPAFDFGHLHSEFYDEMMQRGTEMLGEGRVKLPYPRCIFISESLLRTSLLRPEITVQQLWVAEEGEDYIQVMQFDRDLLSGRWTPWMYCPGTFRLNLREEEVQGIVLTPPGMAGRYGEEMLAKTPEEKESDRQVIFSGTHTLATYLGTLDHRSTEVRDADPSDAMRAVNNGRARGGLAPLPPVRTIRPSAQYVGSTGTGTGSKKRPHDRRGHWRTLDGGRRVAVPPSKIHGGSDTPPIYRI